ncbi:NisI/SpaI family lantibiotic immunity lipoprotein [Clostridium neonatale]|uniref:Lantibiotic biosynthesis protein n=1 Tax=Clostridium neonatale TaxID=137838 RepID=A0AA86JBK6_9CLOT|nr:NisI/SpaI family lantibiotic immunity lipoprotein [Clostridium neonatale]MBP8315621.1 NisI/SpaI family lantibiotic immunity lipoprotein [Clostridium neonatale]CAG9701638.1 Lantibiotic biosynthesis protein [Clostridium neonatale]CAG9712249.1 Lantibiotic biosynthesis protein [Clostridium neonatale]CAI3195846.1 lantibiotic immunity protein [Clostridium neonatale]CAI3197829.1 lantibiotic immunity protein [Clostridium neonatale]
MNKKNITMYIVTSFTITCSILLMGCSKVTQLIDTGKKNLEISKTLPDYTLDETNFKEISIDNKIYTINEECINQNDLEAPIGKISKEFTIDENNNVLNKDELTKIYVIPNEKSEEKRIHLIFGWIYSIKSTDSNEFIAINVNNEYKLATIKK